MSALSAVLGAIARAVLGERDDAPVTIGTVTLRPHQRDALRRVRAGVARFGGALLADEPGLGKTFVALALAREFPHATVVAPAALRAMWCGAMSAAGVRIPFVSLEELSRREVTGAGGGLVIVDEAHHACNPATARYQRLARLATLCRVLLLSATPVRNRRAELAAMLALFMGPNADGLDDGELAGCIVRRQGDSALLPAVDGPHWHRVRPVRGVAARIASLPPPLPALDGREAAELLAMTLARCWASSLAALDTALKRRLQRGAALAALLCEGRVPTRRELGAWVIGEDAVQLAFPIFASHAASDTAKLQAVLDAHVSAVRSLRELIGPRVASDAAARARLLLAIRRRHRGERIVAFTAHASTAEAVYRALSREPGVALLTARGARSAGGARPRSDLIDALASAPPPRTEGEVERDAITLVIATDLLSEGVNLQGASVVVHLDVPWTPAGLEQRVGRAARMGSAHATVHVHGIAAPEAAESLLALGRRFVRKRAASTAAQRAAVEMEALRAAVRGWRRDDIAPHDDLTAHAACAGPPGFVAVLGARGEELVVGGWRRGGGRWTIGENPHELVSLVAAVRRRPVVPDRPLEARARAALRRWLAARRARDSSGARDVSSKARRALVTRLDSLFRATEPHLRAALATRVVRLRRLIEAARGAGAEAAMLELERASMPDAATWIGACESRFARAADAVGAPFSAGVELRALLVLQPPTSPRPRAPPAASP